MTTNEGWEKRIPADCPELQKSPRAVIAQWVGEEPGHELVLYQDGHFEGFAVPIDLIPHVEAEWIYFMKGRLAG